MAGTLKRLSRCERFCIVHLSPTQQIKIYWLKSLKNKQTENNNNNNFRYRYKKLFKTNRVNIAYNNFKEASFNTNLFFNPLTPLHEELKTF